MPEKGSYFIIIVTIINFYPALEFLFWVIQAEQEWIDRK